MTQEYKELLLKDLCTRLPYGVKCDVGEEVPYTLSRIEVDNINGHLLDFIEMKDRLDMQVYLSEVKPYLFPLLSMTKEDIYQIKDILGEDFEINKDGIIDLIRNRCTSLSYFELNALFNYLDKKYFDYRGLIPIGLANDATNLNIY